MAQSDHLRITWVIAIHRHCASAGSACEIVEGLAVCESPWSSLGAGITPGALCCRSGSPPIPAEDCEKILQTFAVDCVLPATRQIIRRQNRSLMLKGPFCSVPKTVSPWD